MLTPSKTKAKTTSCFLLLHHSPQLFPAQTYLAPQSQLVADSRVLGLQDCLAGGVAWDNLTSPCPAFSPFCSGPTARAPWTRRGTKHNVPSVPGFPPMGSFTPRYVVPFGHDLAFKHSDEAVTVPRDSSDHLTIMDLSSSTSWSSSANSLKDSAVKKRRG